MNESAPELSVVVASINGRPYLDACLAALGKQEGGVDAEVIVADRVGAEVTDFVQRNHPEVSLLSFEGSKSVPELRAAGIGASKGRIVAITEDHCIPPSDWFRSIADAHRECEHSAIGGAVDNAATQRVIDWAVFFCEYSNFISPVDEGIVRDLPGPNVSYKRPALDEMKELLRDGYWETFLHWHLEERGYALWSDRRIRVLHKRHYRFFEFFAERYHYGRAFAGRRNEFTTRSRRLVHLLGAPALPGILTVRIARRVLRRERHLSVFLRALPLISVFMIASAAGEWVGYALGPGTSSLRLR